MIAFDRIDRPFRVDRRFEHTHGSMMPMPLPQSAIAMSDRGSRFMSPAGASRPRPNTKTGGQFPTAVDEPSLEAQSVHAQGKVWASRPRLASGSRGRLAHFPDGKFLFRPSRLMWGTWWKR